MFDYSPTTYTYIYRTKINNLPWYGNYEEFSKRLEGRHGGVHGFIGGHMGRLPCTGFEPLFYMHHAYIDCIWQEYRNTQSVYDQENDYPTHASKTLLLLSMGCLM